MEKKTPAWQNRANNAEDWSTEKVVRCDTMIKGSEKV